MVYFIKVIFKMFSLRFLTLKSWGENCLPVITISTIKENAQNQPESPDQFHPYIQTIKSFGYYINLPPSTHQHEIMTMTMMFIQC